MPTILPEGGGSHIKNSYNFTVDTVKMVGESEIPSLIDRALGGFITDNMNQTVSHHQVYGDGEWTKIAFFVKINSEPGKGDGWLLQWMNDEKIFDVRDITWVDVLPDGTKKMVGWNFFSIGLNPIPPLRKDRNGTLLMS